MFILDFCGTCYSLLPPTELLEDYKCPNCSANVELRAQRMQGTFADAEAIRMLRETFGDDVI